LATRVRQALDDGRLLIYGQPAISLQTGDIAHRELLVRMRDESGEVLTASEFLAAAAQEPGLCADIDRWVVDRALAMLVNGSRRARLQVNLSGETLADDDARGRLAATIAASEATTGGLALEVGEGSIRRNVEDATRAVEALAATGCPVVLDGFTAGFGSFEYLQQLPLDQVKIDGAVTKALVADEPDHATMRAIVRLAQGTGKSTVAKLVESHTVLPILRMHGVDMAQGYEVGEPMPLGG
jgi:EAL domain-containing protein (putative c-di-GMP-specific phosphodiesterase class I)